MESDMIVVKNIEIDTVKEDTILAYHFHPEELSSVPPDREIRHDVTEEMIHGKRFINHRGEEFCIGMSEDVQKAIGLPFEAYEDLTSSLKSCQSRYRNLQQSIPKTFWERLKFLFTGKLC